MTDLPAEVFKALGDPVRLRILRTLPRRKVCALLCSVSELAADLKLPQSTVSRHLAILLRADLVLKERECREVYYCLNGPQLDAVRKAIGQLGITN